MKQEKSFRQIWAELENLREHNRMDEAGPEHLRVEVRLTQVGMTLMLGFILLIVLFTLNIYVSEVSAQLERNQINEAFARDGIEAEAEIVDVEEIATSTIGIGVRGTGSDLYHYRVRYRFTAGDGHEYTGETDTAGVRGDGTKTWIVYLPDDPTISANPRQVERDLELLNKYSFIFGPYLLALLFPLGVLLFTIRFGRRAVRRTRAELAAIDDRENG